PPAASSSKCPVPRAIRRRRRRARRMAPRPPDTTRTSMGQAGSPTRYGRIRPPDEAWLAKAPREPILGPELPIIATHHHLWERPGLRAGLPRLTALGLSLDAWVFHPQLADAIDLARAFPAANIIVGHVGGPLGYGPYAGKRDEVFAAWRAGITELARCPNVVM